MLRSGSLRALVCAVVLVVLGTGAAGPATALVLPGAPKPPPSTTTTVPIEPKAYVVVDADTGAVVLGKNDRTPLPPASLTKVITAVTAAPLLDRRGTIPISARAAAQPANKVGAAEGEEWPVEVAMHVMLMQSSNDLAMAVAEAAGGSAGGFQGLMATAGERVGMADGPTLRDPAGLDDEWSVDGGNLVSARDLAIATRALLADPWLASMVARQELEFTAPDGVLHKAANHNKLVLRGGYPGAIGVKTGFTRKAGRSLIGAATRNGRTLIAVVLNVPDTYGWVRTLLDQGFAGTVEAQAGLPRVPETVRLTAADLRPAAVDAAPVTPAGEAVTPIAATPVAARSGGAGATLLAPLGVASVVLVLGTAVLARMRRRALEDYTVRRRPSAGRAPSYRRPHDR